MVGLVVKQMSIILDSACAPRFDISQAGHIGLPLIKAAPPDLQYAPANFIPHPQGAAP